MLFLQSLVSGLPTCVAIEKAEKNQKKILKLVAKEEFCSAQTEFFSPGSGLSVKQRVFFV